MDSLNVEPVFQSGFIADWRNAKYMGVKLTAIDDAMRLLNQIEGAGYRDRHGHLIENNAAYIALRQACFPSETEAQGAIPSMSDAEAMASSGEENGEPA